MTSRRRYGTGHRPGRARRRERRVPSRSRGGWLVASATGRRPRCPARAPPPRPPTTALPAAAGSSRSDLSFVEVPLPPVAADLAGGVAGQPHRVPVAQRVPARFGDLRTVDERAVGCGYRFDPDAPVPLHAHDGVPPGHVRVGLEHAAVRTLPTQFGTGAGLQLDLAGLEPDVQRGRYQRSPALRVQAL